MPTRPSINLSQLIGKRGFGFAGLQDAHIIAREFYRDAALAWLRPLLDQARPHIPALGLGEKLPVSRRCACQRIAVAGATPNRTAAAW
jgi:hypothetical protein